MASAKALWPIALVSSEDHLSAQVHQAVAECEVQYESDSYLELHDFGPHELGKALASGARLLVVHCDSPETVAALRECMRDTTTPCLLIFDKQATPLRAESRDLVHQPWVSDFIVNPIHPSAFAVRLHLAATRARQTSGLHQHTREELFSIQQVADLGHWIWEPSSRYVYWSDQFYRLLGIEPGECSSPPTIGLYLGFVGNDDRERVKAEFKGLLKGGQRLQTEHRIYDNQGRERFLYHRIAKLPAHIDRKGGRYLGTVQDITERKRQERRIYELSHFDDLTGLPNRHFLLERAKGAAARSADSGEIFALLTIDIDHFSRINDSLGYRVGDELLRLVARRLEHGLRRRGRARKHANSFTLVDQLVRLGSDQFVAVVGGLRRPSDTAAVARRLRRLLNEPFEIEGRAHFITVSIGIAVYPKDATDAETLLQRADAAMHTAKESGRDTYRLYDKNINKMSSLRLSIEDRLRYALEFEGFTLSYQPQVSLETGQVTGAEALLRWTDSELGVVTPVQFIPVAEQTGLIIPLGRWVLRKACAEAVTWPRGRDGDLRVCVNLSPLQFHSHTLIDDVRAALCDSGLPPCRLELEMTEGALMEDTEDSRRTLEALRDMGVGLAVDDFGTGYSSLNYLKRFPIDTLKIDRCFINDMGTEERDAAIVDAIIALSTSLNLKVVAEGVETEKQLLFLIARGCHEVQGYYYSPPLPAGLFLEWLSERGRSIRLPKFRKNIPPPPAKVEPASSQAS